ncbi:MAG TPA: hypothetical protein VHW01_08785, partial [Polyangiaceae bacterium]|nr:hypothetical protein [Polyangiaceae bacterium]
MFETLSHDVPEPGVATAVWLQRVQVQRGSQAGLLDVLAMTEKHLAWVAAIQTKALAELDAATDASPDVVPAPGWDSHQRNDAKRSIATEVGLVLKIPAQYAYDRLLGARLLVQRAPRAVELLASGLMNSVQTRDLAHALIDLADRPGSEAGEAIEKVLNRVLDRAVDDSTTRFRERLRRAVMSAAPRT